MSTHISVIPEAILNSQTISKKRSGAKVEKKEKLRKALKG